MVIQTFTIRKLGCGFLFASHSNYGSILHHYETARYWSKIVFVDPLHLTPPLWRGVLSEYSHPVWYGKTRMSGLPDGKRNFEDMFSGIDRIPACDRRTDRHLAAI